MPYESILRVGCFADEIHIVTGGGVLLSSPVSFGED